MENERKKFDQLEFIKAGNKQCQSTQIIRCHSARCFSERSLQGPQQKNQRNNRQKIIVLGNEANVLDQLELNKARNKQ